MQTPQLPLWETPLLGYTSGDRFTEKIGRFIIFMGGPGLGWNTASFGCQLREGVGWVGLGEGLPRTARPTARVLPCAA